MFKYKKYFFCKKINFYEVLEISSFSSQKEIKLKYKELAKTYHPDVYKGKDIFKFNEVKNAYETLRNPIKRKRYDKSIGINQEIDDKFKSKENKFEGKEEELYKFNEDISYKNIDLEIEKLKNRNVSSNFGKLKTRKNIVEQNMNEYEIKSQEFKDNFNKDYFEKYQSKFKNDDHSSNVDDMIDMLNVEERMKNKKPKLSFYVKYKKYIYITLTWILIFSIYEIFKLKLFYRNEIIEKYKEIKNKKFEFDKYKVRNSFIFDYN